ncbi:Hypothetical protein, putative [Bodo saltans]|uniref:C3H1-type domain-containing protein n=1 Tax=Bodo saltans TaxID=75058 RepID=A0A0S4ITW7_BODSA|nr:Hypothetical protein, putative [Bodo saltans]|eukprot:CUF92483.1 Hypothetical protein, putative [Bodo saltans]
MSTSAESTVTVNEFEIDAVIASGMTVQYLDDCSESDASSDAGSDWLVPEEFSDDDGDDVDLQKGLLAQTSITTALITMNEQEQSVVLLPGTPKNDDVFRGFIGMDTLRISMPPIQQEVMPELQAVIIEEVILSDEALKPRAAKTLMRTYQHNPYHHRAIACRTTARFFESFKTDASYDNLPMCPCALMALVSAKPQDIAQLHKSVVDHKRKTTPELQPVPQIQQKQSFPSFSVSSVPRSFPLPADVSPAPSRQQRLMCCYFKQNGNCKMGAKCWHAHEGDLYTPCHYGTSCKAGHASLLQMQSPFTAAPSFTLAADAMVAKTGITIRIGGPQVTAPPIQLNQSHNFRR